MSDYEMYIECINDSDRIDEAIEYIRKVVTTGRPGSHNELADALVKRGSPEDIKEAFNICKTGTESGNLWSQYRLATYYRDGLCVEPDTTAAIDLMIAPAEARIKRAIVDLEKMLAKRTEEKYQKQLFRLYLMGSFEGDEWSMIKAARCYSKGIGVNPDIALSKILYGIVAPKNETAKHELWILSKKSE